MRTKKRTSIDCGQNRRPLRPVVSCINTFTYDLSAYVANILSPLTSSSDFMVVSNSALFPSSLGVRRTGHEQVNFREKNCHCDQPDHMLLIWHAIILLKNCTQWFILGIAFLQVQSSKKNAGVGWGLRAMRYFSRTPPPTQSSRFTLVSSAFAILSTRWMIESSCSILFFPVSPLARVFAVVFAVQELFSWKFPNLPYPVQQIMVRP